MLYELNVLMLSIVMMDETYFTLPPSCLFLQGRKHKSCPYFVSRKLHQARPAITFAPYAYLLNSSIRQATGIDLKDAIVVFDEVPDLLCAPHYSS